jgi:hypothetical protein
MSQICEQLHRYFQSLKRFNFPFKNKEIPKNGIYILYEKNEHGHGSNRIVRVGSHTGDNQLRSRLKQHFLIENKDRSIFRKNIGRCLLNSKNDPYLAIWELDSTSREMKENNKYLIQSEYQLRIEKEVSTYIQNNFSFCVLQVDEKEKRLQLESKIISTVSLCTDCYPSDNWLGLHSPKEKIRQSGLWLVNELYKESLSIEELKMLI